ncbi:Neurobeachin-like protein 2, partial [Varanus komodoensis]
LFSDLNCLLCFLFQKDLAYLQQWLELFVANFEKIISVHSLEPRREPRALTQSSSSPSYPHNNNNPVSKNSGIQMQPEKQEAQRCLDALHVSRAVRGKAPEESVSEIPLLPRDVLHVLTQQLAHCVPQSARQEVAEAGLGQALLIVKFFIIICRNLENVQADRPPAFVREVINLLSAYSRKLKSTQGQPLPSQSRLENVTLYALHLSECLFDPYQTWRRQLSGEIVSMKEKSKYKFPPVVLPPEFNSFFQECFQEGDELPEALQLRLIHLFGAVLSGGKASRFPTPCFGRRGSACRASPGEATLHRPSPAWSSGPRLPALALQGVQLGSAGWGGLGRVCVARGVRSWDEELASHLSGSQAPSSRSPTLLRPGQGAAGGTLGMPHKVLPGGGGLQPRAAPAQLPTARLPSPQQHNALLAVTPSSVEVLMLVLRRWCSPAGGAPRDPRLLQLALKSLVRMVHVLHGSSPGQRKVEIRAIVDCYFKVLNADQPMAARDGPPGPRWEERLVALRVSMLDAIPEMLNCDDRPVLQAFFLSNNCFEHIIRLIQNSKLYLSSEHKAPGSDLAPQPPTEPDPRQPEEARFHPLLFGPQVFSGNSDVIAIHAIGVLTSIMSSSPSAKEVFKERIGYSHLYDVLKSQSQSQPSRMLLQELLNMVGILGPPRAGEEGQRWEPPPPPACPMADGSEQVRLQGGEAHKPRHGSVQVLQPMRKRAIRAVEGDHSSVPPRLIRNEQPLLILIAWIPELQSPDLQVFLSDRLRRICDASLQSRTTCVKAGMVGCLLDALCAAEPRPDPRCSGDLLHLLQVLGGLSIQPGELRQLLQLLRTEPGQGPHPYTVQVVRALSGMARGDTPKRALQYFDLTPGMAGIMVPAIQKWPGGGFAFHAWVCLVEETQDSPEEAPRLKRKQLYSFFTASGTGFEAFFTADGVLVVAVCTKKEYMTVALPEFPFNDAAWHCVDIVHVAGRRPFGQNLVNVFVDGQLRKGVQLRFPSLSESFTSCCIGSAGHRTTTTSTGPLSPPHSPDLGFPSHPPLSRSQSFPASLAAPAWTPVPPQPPRESAVATTAAGSQDTEWGVPTSLEGHLGPVAIFCEALQPAQVKALFASGPNVASPFKPEGDFLELSNKLLLYYTPQACKNNICLDLSSNHFFDGRLTGHKRVNWDIKDVVNCVGGMGVLLPLLDQLASQKKASEDQPETHDLVGPELTSSRNAQGMLIPLGQSAERLFLPTESRLERNGVAAFLLLVKNFLRGHPVNQESLVQCQGPAIIGALLQKVPSQAMDMNVLMASQILMEQVASEGHSLLLHLLYQYLLFDFRIWSNSDFAVRLGHIQYLSNVIKDHKQRIRKKYGVQYILDSIRTYYGSCKEKPVATDDIRTVQTSLFSLIKDFFCRSFSTDEMQSTLNYLAAVNDEHQVCGVLEVIHSLQKSSPSQEQVYTFLFELGNVEILFSLLVQRKFSDEVRERVFKILYKLLKYEKVNERSKHRLKLKDIGYQGFISFLNDVPVSMLLFRCLLEQVLGSDSPNYKDLVAVVYLSHRAELPVRLDVCRKLFHLIYSQSDVVKQLARLAGWQDTLTKLYVKESYESRQHSLSGSANGTGCPPDLLRSANPPGAEAGREPPDVASPSACDPPDLDVFLPLGYEGSDHELSEGFSDHSVSPTGQRSRPFHPDGAFKSFDSLELASHGSSSNMDIPGQGEGRAGEALQPDRVYCPLSPFCMSPFDLALDLGSASSTAESGNQTPVSLPGTPSPLENFKPFPGTRARKSSSLSNVLDESSYQETLPSDTISNTSNPQ